MGQLAKVLIITGIILTVAGLIIYFAGDKLSWIGHLPGDINIRKENIRIFIPVTTMIILSVIISVLLYIIRRFL